MRRGYVAFLTLALIAAGLAGCGLFRFEQREAWRDEAERACLAQKLVRPSAYMSLRSAIDGPGACGMNHPFKVAALADGSVALTQQATLACPIIARTDQWLQDVVQPAAALYFGTTVVELKSGSYSCRPRNNRRGAKLSEHSFGNAVDVMSFRLANGREVSVMRGWRGSPEEQDFLREVFVGACNYFTTVLGPGSDAFHYDHLHLDLARHDPQGLRRVCKPTIKFTPRLADDAAAGPLKRPPGGWQPADLPPSDMEEETDPFAVESTRRPQPQPAQLAQPAPSALARAGWPAPTVATPASPAPPRLSPSPPQSRAVARPDTSREAFLPSREPSPPPLQLSTGQGIY